MNYEEDDLPDDEEEEIDTSLPYDEDEYSNEDQYDDVVKLMEG